MKNRLYIAGVVLGIAALLALSRIAKLPELVVRVDAMLAPHQGARSSDGFISSRDVLADPKVGQIVSLGRVTKPLPTEEDLPSLALPEGDDPQVAELLALLASAESRVPGYPGYEKVSQELVRIFTDIFGPENTHVDEFPVTVPVTTKSRIILQPSANSTTQPSAATELAVHPLWPFGVKLHSFAGGSAEGLLIDGGRGDLEELDGKPVKDSFVLLSFDSGEAYLRARQLGARGVILLSRGEINFHQALRKFCATPVDAPLFFAEPDATEALLAGAAAGRQIRLEVHSEWREVMARNIWGRFPGAEGALPAKKRKWSRAEWDDNNLLVNAFYDSMSIVPAKAPGASATPGLISLVQSARYMKRMRDAGKPNQHGVVFLANGAHYIALQGMTDFISKHSRHELHQLRRRIAPEDRIEPRLTLSLEMTDKDPRPAFTVAGLGIEETPFYTIAGERERSSRWMQRALSIFRDINKGIYGDGERMLDAIKPPRRSFRSMMQVENDLSFDSDPLIFSGFPAIPVTTADDPRERSDTPADTFDKLNVRHIHEQVRTLAPAIYVFSRDAEAFENFNFVSIGYVRGTSLKGRAAWYDVKSNFSSPAGRIGEGGLAVLTCAQSRIPTRNGVRVDIVQKLQFNSPAGGDESQGYSARLGGQTGWRLHVSKTRLGQLEYVDAAELSQLPLEAVFERADGRTETCRFEGRETEFFCELPNDLKRIKSVLLKSRKGSRALFENLPLHDATLTSADFRLKVGLLRYARLEVWSKQFSPDEMIRAEVLMRGPQTLARTLSYDPQATEQRGVPTYSAQVDSSSLGIRLITRGETGVRLFGNITFEDTFAYPLIMQGGGGQWPRPRVDCYRLNHDGAIDFATDLGPQGAQSYPNVVPGIIDGPEAQLMVVLFPCRAISLFDIVDSRYMRALDVLQLLSPDDSEPIHHGQFLPIKQSTEERFVPLVAAAFVEPEMPLKALMSSDFFGLKYLLINMDDSLIDRKYLRRDEKGWQTTLPDSVQDLRPTGYPADESVIFNPTYQVARDIWLLDDSRVKKLAQYGVKNQRLDELHEDAYAQLVRAKEALEQREYSEHIRAANEAWGLEARAYPDVKGTAIDTVKGIIFYFALLLPFAFFMERLLFGFTDFRRQIAGLSVMFFLAFLVLRWVHPAFRISDSPYVILLAFIILVLGGIVTLAIALKFRGEIQKMRAEASGIIEADVGRLSATYSAVILGISNLRKRKMRTALTATTICLLTFTVLSFTSVVHQLDFWRIPVSSDYAPHVGALVRNRDYRPMQPQAYAMLKQAFDGKARVLRRNWMIYSKLTPEMGFYEMVNPDNGQKAIANAFLGLEPQETQLPVAYSTEGKDYRTGNIKDMLVQGSRWFNESEREADAVILPTFLAETLQITPAQVASGGARVEIFKRQFTVTGIFDEKQADQARFLDNEPIMPLDMSAVPPETIGGVYVNNPAESGAQMLTILPHLPSRSVPILPYETMEALGCGVRHVAIYDFAEQSRALEEIKNFMRRVSLSVFVGDGKSIEVYSTMGSPSFSGLGKLFIPILIVAALVMNTMMGAVYERTREIGIYSSVGLAPNHIGALFLAESLVFATVGAVIGYLISQALAFALAKTGSLAGINLNYSSISAVLATLIVMATVLASTIFPARKASQMSVPDVSRRWKIDPPEGDTWKFVFPFTIAGMEAAGLNVYLRDYFQAYTDNSVADFFTRNVRLETIDDSRGRGPSYRLSMRVWLAPYDMSISQELTMQSVPTEYHNVYEVHVTLQRLSGEISSWTKMTYRFLTTLRKRFLLWRTIPQGIKVGYAQTLARD